MTESSRPKVFLVEDHPLTLFGLQRYLGERYELIGSASEASIAIQMILERRPDLVLLDVQFPGGGGAAVIEAVKPRAPDVKFLAFTVSTSAEDVVRLFKAGVDGYVVKTTEGFELEEQIEEASPGGGRSRDTWPVICSRSTRSRPPTPRSTVSPLGSARWSLSSPGGSSTGRPPRISA